MLGISSDVLKQIKFGMLRNIFCWKFLGNRHKWSCLEAHGGQKASRHLNNTPSPVFCALSHLFKNRGCEKVVCS